jgi:hypothetical protein
MPDQAKVGFYFCLKELICVESSVPSLIATLSLS